MLFWLFGCSLMFFIVKASIIQLNKNVKWNTFDIHNTNISLQYLILICIELCEKLRFSQNHIWLKYSVVKELIQVGKFVVVVFYKFTTKKKDIRLNIIQCYAPTNDVEEEKKDDFYQQLQAVLDRRGAKNITILMGDFNTKIRMDNTGYEGNMGTHELGQMNENGECFADLCSEAIKADIETAVNMLYSHFSKIWEKEEVPAQWKEGIIIKLPKKGDLRAAGTIEGSCSCQRQARVSTGFYWRGWRRLSTPSSETRGRYHVEWRLSPDDRFHSPTVAWRQVLDLTYHERRRWSLDYQISRHRPAMDRHGLPHAWPVLDSASLSFKMATVERSTRFCVKYIVEHIRKP